MTRAFFISCVIHAVLAVFLLVSLKSGSQAIPVERQVVPVSLIQVPKKTGQGAVGGHSSGSNNLALKDKSMSPPSRRRQINQKPATVPEKEPAIANTIISDTPVKPSAVTASLSTPVLNTSDIVFATTGEKSGSGTGRFQSAGNGPGQTGDKSGHGSGGNDIAGVIDPLSIIRAAIEQEAKSSYPIKARKLKMEGKVVVKFGILKNGYPDDISVLAGSGYATLDDAAADIVRKAAPFPFLPEPVQVPIRFSLK